MSDTSHRTARSPAAFIGLIAAAVLVVLAIVFFAMGESPVSETNPDSDTVTEQRPTGAGTNPDGVVDESTEGLSNETATDEFIDSSSASGPDGIDAEASGAPEPATSAEDLEPAVGEGNVETMTEPEQSN